MAERYALLGMQPKKPVSAADGKKYNKKNKHKANVIMTKGTIAKKTIESIFSNIEKEEIETKECLEALVECELAPKGAITWLTQRAQIKQVKSLFQQHVACAANNGYQLLKDKPKDIPDDAYCYKNFNGYRISPSNTSHHHHLEPVGLGQRSTPFARNFTGAGK